MQTDCVTCTCPIFREVKRSEIKYEVCFGGKTETKNGKTVWIPNQKVSCHAMMLEGVMGLTYV